MAKKDELGRRGEDLAAEHLERRGYRILDRNWRCREGEIDLIARDGATLVFVEVKTRSSLAFGHPLEAITARKLARLRRLAAAWCSGSAERADGNAGASGIRLDAIGIVAPPDAVPSLEHRTGLGR